MSSIDSIGSSSSSNSAAVYQEYLARLQAQKQAAKSSETNEPAQDATSSAGDVDHDGDSH
jgi:hypothetical protein